MHIVNDVRTLKTFLKNLPFSIKSGLACKAQLPRNSSFSFFYLFIYFYCSFKSLKIREMRSKMTKDTTMVTNNGFRSTRLFREGSSTMVLFLLQHGALRSYVTDHTAVVASMNKLRST